MYHINAVLAENKQLQLVVAVVCGVGGGAVAMLVVVGAVISIYKAMTGGKDNKYRQKDNDHRPINLDLNETDEAHLLQSMEVQSSISSKSKDGMKPCGHGGTPESKIMKDEDGLVMGNQGTSYGEEKGDVDIKKIPEGETTRVSPN